MKNCGGKNTNNKSTINDDRDDEMINLTRNCSVVRKINSTTVWQWRTTGNIILKSVWCLIIRISEKVVPISIEDTVTTRKKKWRTAGSAIYWWFIFKTSLYNDKPKRPYRRLTIHLYGWQIAHEKSISISISNGMASPITRKVLAKEWNKNRKSIKNLRGKKTIHCYLCNTFNNSHKTIIKCFFSVYISRGQSFVLYT